MFHSRSFQCAVLLVLMVFSLNGQASEVLFQKGLGEFQKGNFKQAELVFSGLLEEGKNIAQLHNNLAAVYSAQRHYDKALSHLERAVQQNTVANIAFNNLNKVYGLVASQAYQQAMGEKPEIVQGLHLVLVEKWQEEVAAVKKIEESAPVVLAFDAETARGELLDTVASWAAAWSAQDTEAYLAKYSEEFVPPQKVSRTLWEKTRRLRLTTPSFIKISLSDLNIVYFSSGFASVTFMQTYQSDRLNDTVAKNLIFSNAGGQWKIVQEQLIR